VRYFVALLLIAHVLVPAMAIEVDDLFEDMA
jgi:hypothetical protein